MLQQLYFFENKGLYPVDSYQAIPENHIQVYEVLRVIDGVPLFLEGHLERLEKSLLLAGGQNWLSLAYIQQSIQQLIEANKVKTGNIKLAFAWSENLKVKTYQSFFIPHKYPDLEDYLKGVPTDLLYAERTNPNAKIEHTPVRVLANKMIKAQELFEVLLVDNHGSITEGSRSNCFFIKNETIYTAPVRNVLPGITREEVLKVCQNLGLTIREEAIHHSKLANVDALFITGTSPGVLPVCLVGQQNFPARFPLLEQIRNAYEAAVRDYIQQY